MPQTRKFSSSTSKFKIRSTRKRLKRHHARRQRSAGMRRSRYPADYHTEPLAAKAAMLQVAMSIEAVSASGLKLSGGLSPP